MSTATFRRSLSALLLAAPASCLVACGSPSSQFDACGSQSTVVVPLATIQADEADAATAGDAGPAAGEPTDHPLLWSTCAQVCPSSVPFPVCTVVSTEGSQATVHCISECPG